MISSLLIANRGEIAVRIIRTARSLGVRTIAVHSDADARALHVAEADAAVAIGPSPAAESYLVIERILEAAKETGAEAIHPGYGFLSENADFAEACQSAGIVFVGPPADAIRAMGLKDRAKALMEGAGVPVVPGFHGQRQETDFLREKAYEIGYPVLIKAVAGGGGKGMRRVDKQIAFDEALTAARREAQAAFGDARVLVEKFVAAPRHIEVQVFGDRHGNIVHLYERDCSLQRRHQKVVEEAPAPGMTEGLRRRMGDAAVAAARAVSYEGAGTVEFIVDGSKPLNDETSFYFMEMNTRLQVEHPVTEAVTGLDLVDWQLRIASGEKLPLNQGEIGLDGHAVEVRLYAEDPEADFLPSTGTLYALRFADGPGIRIDSGVRENDMVTPFYDPMIAKVIAHAPTRSDALDRLSDALDATRVAGPRSNLGFLGRLIAEPDFRGGIFDTGFIDQRIDGLTGALPGERDAAIVLGAWGLVQRNRARADMLAVARGVPAQSPWSLADGFALGPRPETAIDIVIEGTPETVAMAWDSDGPTASSHDATEAVLAGAEADLVETPDGVLVLIEGRQYAVVRADRGADADHAADDVVRAPMHGRVVSVLVEMGGQVVRGDKIAIVEAMKMEHAVTAGRDGVVGEIIVADGAQVGEGDVIARIVDVDGGADAGAADTAATEAD
ncbi:MAG: acetyl/propionyl/methylcrotonyl-CoA carboxylase subunit alpha [Pseudomonadota bacterium]